MIKEIGCYLLNNDERAIPKLKSYNDCTPGLVLRRSSTPPTRRSRNFGIQRSCCFWKLVWEGYQTLTLLGISATGLYSLPLTANMPSKVSTMKILLTTLSNLLLITENWHYVSQTSDIITLTKSSFGSAVLNRSSNGSNSVPCRSPRA